MSPGEGDACAGAGGWGLGQQKEQSLSGNSLVLVIERNGGQGNKATDTEAPVGLRVGFLPGLGNATGTAIPTPRKEGEPKCRRGLGMESGILRHPTLWWRPPDPAFQNY